MLEPEAPEEVLEYDFYGSVRLRAINEYDPETGKESGAIGDGASRIGVSGGWHLMEGWNLFGRLERGFDVLDTFTAKAQSDKDGGALTHRLHSLGPKSDWRYVKLGKVGLPITKLPV